MDHHVSKYLFKNSTLENPIYVTALEQHVKPSRKEVVEAIQKNIETNVLGNVYANSTGWDLHQKSDIIKSVCYTMKLAVHEILCELMSGTDGVETATFDYDPLNCWGVIYKENDATKVHWHYPSTMSQVYYVQVESNSSPLIFTDIDLEITPESGMLISFPPWLRHTVPPLEKNDQRVVLSANWLMTKGGQPETPN